MLEYLILGILNNCELTGYEIKSYIDRGIGISTKSSFGSLYPALARLLKKGLLVSRSMPQGKRERIFYTITEEGKKALIAWLKTPMEVPVSDNENLVKIFFFDLLPKDEAKKLIEDYEQKNVDYLNELYKKEEEFKNSDTEKYYFRLSTLYQGILSTKANIEWCRHIKDRNDLKELH